MFRRLLPLFIIFLLAGIAPGREILIYDRDWGDVFPDPDGGGSVGCEYAIENALADNGCSFTTIEGLPENLDPYDAIFIVMGSYC